MIDQVLVGEREDKLMFDNRVRISFVQYRRPQRKSLVKLNDDCDDCD